MCGVPRLLIPNSIPTHLPDFNLRLISCLLKFLGKIQHKEALDGSVGPEEVTIYKLTVPKIDPGGSHNGNASLLYLEIMEPNWLKECTGPTLVSVVYGPQVPIRTARLLTFIYQPH